MAARHNLFGTQAQHLARQAADHLNLIGSPTERLARKVAADHLNLIGTPAQRLAQKIAAEQLTLIDNPMHRIARQVADSMPKLDVAVDLHRPSGRDEAVDEVEQSAPSDPSGARADGPDDTADDDRESE